MTVVGFLLPSRTSTADGVRMSQIVVERPSVLGAIPS